EKQPVLAVKYFRYPDRASQSESILIKPEWIFWWHYTRECVVLCIQGRVPKKLERRSVKLVAAWFGGDIDLSDGAAELRGIDACLNFEFLKHVDGRQEEVTQEVDIGIFDPIQS